MKDNIGFTLLELVVALFICSIILVVLVPNLINEYQYINKLENKLELKEVLYEEILNHKEKEFSINRDNYSIIVTKNKAEIFDHNSGEKVVYE